MIILGVDPGTATTGYAFLESKLSLGSKKQNIEVLAYGVVTTGKSLEMPFRLKYIHHQLSLLCKKYKPDLMVIEKLFFNTNAKTAMTVGQARGVVLLLGAQFNIPVYEYTALQAKWVLTGYGRASKEQVQNAVRKFLGLVEKVKPDDANDAIAMALCHLNKSIKLN